MCEDPEVTIKSLKKELKKLEKRVAAYHDAMEDLMGEQNGPPLIRDQHHWVAAMNKCYDAMGVKTEVYQTTKPGEVRYEQR